ncbi:uncharacterized protein LOC106645534 [Copidosoma floridanum]|uniref:uncharacterized protein LOC106645534 n=1 Tax=Copidosoma floridanum TaxID=29053 RepID=UPI0006C94C30|nr:uncharacterized protein LOC106645534 [Copidosoma floridanum]
MYINPMKWKTRTLGYSGLGLFGFYLLFIYKWTHHLLYKAVVDSEPKYVWEYVADFSNMMKLNPTIKEFDIIDESGNYDHWKYSVKYTERLSHFPIVQNTAHGHYSVKPKAVGFVIESKHRTCFLMGMSCLNSYSEFIFVPEGKSTKCIEKIDYECPLIFSSICRKEVTFQRQEIMKNLQSHFSTVNLDKEK